MEDKFTYIIDRFEADYAVCERDDLKFVNIPKKELPKEAKEGDIIKFNGESYEIDTQKSKARKREIEELTKDLWM